LLVSFALLHEITAIVPLVGFFFAARYAGTGNMFVEAMREMTDGQNIEDGTARRASESWLRGKLKEYHDEGLPSLTTPS